MRLTMILGFVVLIVAVTACGGGTPAPQFQPTAFRVPTRVPTSPRVVTATPEPPSAAAAPTEPPQAEATATALVATPLPVDLVPEDSKLIGAYGGILPAADSPGRIVNLELALDGTATMTTQFIGRGAPIVENGTWVARDDEAVVTFTVREGAPEDNRITWRLEGNQLVSTVYDLAQYGTEGLTLTRIGTGDIIETAFEGVSFSFDSSLAQSAQGQFLAPVPVQNEPALGGGAPKGALFKFNDETLPDFFDPRLPQVYVFPVEGLKQLDPSVAQGVESLQKLIQAKPAAPTEPIFVFPLIPSSQGMRVNVRYLDFVNGSGVRFVTYYSQDISPVTNDRIFYTFQGITLDGEWYVSVFWPLSTPALPNADNAPDTSHYDARQFEDYLNQIVTTLDSLPAGGYQPNLSLLDNLVQSVNAAPLFPTPTPEAQATQAAPAEATQVVSTATPEAAPAATTTSTTGTAQMVSAEYQGTSIQFSPTLAQSAQGVTIPAVAVNENAPGLGGGAPENIAFGFNGETVTTDVNPFQPAVRVYSAEQLMDTAPQIAKEVLALKSLLDVQPTTLNDPLPMFPLFPAQQLIHPQIKYLNFQGGRGVRCVTFLSQNLAPVTNDGLFYTFQGLTEDDKSYVTVFWQVSTSALPNSYEDADIEDMDAWSKHFEAYLAETNSQLDDLSPGEFTPDLELLDQLVESVRVTSP